MKLYADESFGSVVTVQRVDSDEEAIQLANDSEYGLSAAVFSRDISRALNTCNWRSALWAGIPYAAVSADAVAKFQFTLGSIMRAGYVVLPALRGQTAPSGDKHETRYRGPHVMVGYWRATAEESDNTFDEEGYFRSGDALRFVDVERPELGLLFGGRIAEDFKLSSGTFVSVGPMRARVISEGAPMCRTWSLPRSIATMWVCWCFRDSTIAGARRDCPRRRALATTSNRRRRTGQAPFPNFRGPA